MTTTPSQPNREEAEKLIEEFSVWHRRGKWQERNSDAKLENGLWYWKGYKVFDLHQMMSGNLKEYEGENERIAKAVTQALAEEREGIVRKLEEQAVNPADCFNIRVVPLNKFIASMTDQKP